MGLAVAIQMDPIETINIDGDTSFVLALEAQARGHALYHYLPTQLTLRDGRLRARGRRFWRACPAGKRLGTVAGARPARLDRRVASATSAAHTGRGCSDPATRSSPAR